MFDPFVQKAFDKIKDAGLAPVYLEQVSLLEKHIAFLSDRLVIAEKDMAKTEGKMETQTKELESLRSQLASFDGKARLVDIGPCFVKEDKTGVLLEGFYCPICQKIMTSGINQYDPEDNRVYYKACKFYPEVNIIHSAFADYEKRRKQE